MGKRGAQPLDKNPFWKGGRTIASNGYVLVKTPNHPNADVRGYVYEHRLIAEQKIGRYLEKGEIVHHKDGNKQNNNPDNLEVVNGVADHFLEHRSRNSKRRLPGEDNPYILCACGCGQQFQKFDQTGRPRKFVTGHNMYIGR
jgi:hypothetical protein